MENIIVLSPYLHKSLNKCLLRSRFIKYKSHQVNSLICFVLGYNLYICRAIYISYFILNWVAITWKIKYNSQRNPHDTNGVYLFDFIQEISNFKPVMPNRDKNKSLKYLFNNIKKIIYAHTKFRVSNLLSCTTFSNLFIKKISNLYYSNNDFAVIAIKL